MSLAWFSPFNLPFNLPGSEPLWDKKELTFLNAYHVLGTFTYITIFKFLSNQARLVYLPSKYIRVSELSTDMPEVIQSLARNWNSARSFLYACLVAFWRSTSLKLQKFGSPKGSKSTAHVVPSLNINDSQFTSSYWNPYVYKLMPCYT